MEDPVFGEVKMGTVMVDIAREGIQAIIVMDIRLAEIQEIAMMILLIKDREDPERILNRILNNKTKKVAFDSNAVFFM